jgi:hypothetical protein
VSPTARIRRSTAILLTKGARIEGKILGLKGDH